MRYFSFLLILLVFLTTHAQSLTSAEEYSQRGIARFEKNDLNGAIADFTAAIDMNGRDLQFCYYFRGIARYRLGNLDEAIVDLGKAISLKPHPRFYDDRGNLLAKKGDSDAAIADLNKAIEIAPNFAKAYGDRGIVHLMRGEDTQAESDFKRCFELDRTLETQIRTAASQIKQRAILGYDQAQPSDVQVIKFSWTEVPASTLSAAPSTLSTSTSAAVSSSGTRILANPADKGDPGPLADPSMAPPGTREVGRTTRSLVVSKSAVSLRNIGNKTIVGVRWGHFFYPKDTSHEPIGFVFRTKTNIAPGKEKSFSEQTPVATELKRSSQIPTNSNRTLFNERIIILRLDYAEGTTWQSRPTP